jgi:hypothetical protein
LNKKKAKLNQTNIKCIFLLSNISYNKNLFTQYLCDLKMLSMIKKTIRMLKKVSFLNGIDSMEYET